MKTGVFYFTFDKHLNQNTYVAVIAENYADAVMTLKEKYGEYTKCFNEEQWRTVKEHYKNIEPEKIIWTESSLGYKPKGYNDLFVFVEDTKQIIHISEGTGDNLLPEDISEGYVDYIFYEQYDLATGIESVDGGQVLLKELFREKYSCTADCLSDVLDMAYGNSILKCKIIM